MEGQISTAKQAPRPAVPKGRSAPSGRNNRRTKRNGVGSTIARSLNAGVGGLANYFLPGSGSLVSKLGSSILDSFGLAEKTRLPEDFGAPTSTGGGTVIQSANAPVSFARGEQTMTSIEHLGSSGGDAVYRVRDYIGEVYTGAAPNVRALFLGVNKPTGVYPLLNRIAGSYELFKLLGAKLHYVHYAPTSVQGRVILSAANIPFDYNTADAQDFVTLENSTAGSVYEDFALEWIPDDVINWYGVYKAYNIGDLSSFQGTWYCYVDQFADSDLERPVGTLYIEYYVALKNQRSPDLPLLTLTNAIASASVEEKRAALSFALSKIEKLTNADVREYVISRELLPDYHFHEVKKQRQAKHDRLTRSSFLSGSVTPASRM